MLQLLQRTLLVPKPLVLLPVSLAGMGITVGSGLFFDAAISSSAMTQLRSQPGEQMKNQQRKRNVGGRFAKPSVGQGWAFGPK